MPRSSSQRITPPAASRPKALPPASRTACTFSTAFTGASSSVSRVPGAAPRTSTPQTAPPSASTTVQPVGRRESVKWPTERPATAVRPLGTTPFRQHQIQAKTPAVSCIRAETSPRWNIVSPKLSSITVSRLK